MSAAPVVLIDLSSIAHPIFHLSASEPDPNWTSTQIVARVRALASGQPHGAICCDSGRSFRRELDPTYKANRPESDATLQHQIALAIDALKADGFPVWAVAGMEADDLIASAVKRALEDGSTPIAHNVLIVSADKDLLQLVGPRVQQLRPGIGTTQTVTYDEAAVVAKFGVRPDQMRDYLALVGDSSDNIKGAKGIGPKRAADLLAKHGTLAAIMTPEVAEQQTPAVRESLIEFASRADAVQALVTLKSDVPLPFEEVFRPRVVADTKSWEDPVEAQAERAAALAEDPGPRPTAIPPTEESPRSRVDRAVDASVLSQPAEPASLVPVEREWQLEPRTLDQAKELAAILHGSRLFSAYGTPAAVLTTIMAGRELGLQAMASMRAFHIIENRPTLSAGIIQAMVLKSPACEYFRCTERTNERATFETKRRGDPPMSLTFTMDDAKMAWSKGDDAFKKSGYGKNPADMCVARAATKLARLVYPDVVSGLYAPEEFA